VQQYTCIQVQARLSVWSCRGSGIISGTIMTMHGLLHAADCAVSTTSTQSCSLL
jgi:hypothetical protein